MTLDPFRSRLLAAAIRAPSGDNCQPWWFQFDSAGRILIGIRLDRAKSFFDFRLCGTYLSVGAVIENIRVQAASEGFAVETEYLASRELDEPVAAACLKPAPHGDAVAAANRRSAMLGRTVNRRPFFYLAPSKQKLLRMLADPVPGVDVHVISRRSAMSRWARVIYLADRIRYSHPLIHEELFSKILYNPAMKDAKRAGLEIDRLGIGPGAASVMRFLESWERVDQLSQWGLTTALATQSRLLALGSGAMVLVTVPAAMPENWIRAGEQMERLWIGAHELGLSVHPMTVSLYLDRRYQIEGLDGFLPHHMVLLKRMREELAELIPHGIGAMLFRLGYAWPMRTVAVRLPPEQFVRTELPVRP